MAVSSPLNKYPAIYTAEPVQNLGVSSVQANAGELILFTVQYRDQGSRNISVPPTWNGQNMVSAGARLNGYMWAQTWSVIASSTATANIIATVDSGEYLTGVSLARTYSGVSSIAAAVTQSLFDGTYANPSLTSGALAAGDLIDETLASSGYSADGGFSDMTGVTWAETNAQTRQNTVLSTSTDVGNLIFSTKSGTGSINVGYTPTGGQPAYVHMLLQLIAGGPAASIDSITTDGSPGLVVGEPFLISTTGLGTITSITVTTAATPAATTTAINLSAGAGEMKYWIDGQYFPYEGTVTVVASDGTLTATGTFNLSIPADQADVVFNAVETTDATYVTTKLADIGHPVSNGDKGYYPPIGGFTIGTNGHISSPDGATTFVLWIHKTSGIIEMYNVVINDAGEITDATGITSRGITTRGITSRNITSRGLS